MTNTTQHTPGPWEASWEDPRWIIQCDGLDGIGKRAIAWTAGHYPNHEQNARLIAAAPDLLDLLHNILMQNDTDGAYSSYGAASLSPAMRARVIDTIAKAKGGA